MSKTFKADGEMTERDGGARWGPVYFTHLSKFGPFAMNGKSRLGVVGRAVISLIRSDKAQERQINIWEDYKWAF